MIRITRVTQRNANKLGNFIQFIKLLSSERRRAIGLLKDIDGVLNTGTNKGVVKVGVHSKSGLRRP